MPEWSNGAVSKTVDRIHDPRVRIPFSPQKERLPTYVRAAFSVIKDANRTYFVTITQDILRL